MKVRELIGQLLASTMEADVSLVVVENVTEGDNLEIVGFEGDEEAITIKIGY